MPDNYGASKEQWRYWSATLGLTADLLPVVSRPDAPISPASKIRKVGKTPSRYNQQRLVSGMKDWTTYQASSQDIAAWAKEPDYGICVQTRRLRAIDVDVADEADAARIEKLLARLFTHPRRHRNGSGKFLVPFWHEAPLAKHVIPVQGGMVEILGDGQQFVAQGMHESGERYRWVGSIEAAPQLDEIDFAMLLAELRRIATGPVKIARTRRELNGVAVLDVKDDVAEWLIDNWETYDVGADGQIFIACPFSGEHTSDTGESSTAYFPAGTGGFTEGNFVCLHAHCAGREQAEFLNTTGFVAGGFGIIPQNDPDLAKGSGPDGEAGVSEVGRVDDHDVSRDGRQALIATERWPRLTRDSNGRIEATMHNLMLALASPAMMGRYIAYDQFKDEIVQAPADRPFEQAQWQAFRDSDYARVRQALEVRGFKAMGTELLRLAVLTVAEEHSFDVAQEWLSRLTWDGTCRVSRFATRGWGWADTPYSNAVSRYVWTGLAGRIMVPGVQADMVPILVGPQGQGKTSAIKAMSPDPNFYASIHLDTRDSDTSRLLRGTLIAELEELRGLNSRAEEEIKAWLTKTHEKWVPKFREFAATYGRRNLFFGTTNHDEILGDPTGERRYLPGRCDTLDIDWIGENRDQLWAEGASMFLLDGLDWYEAEKLARIEHGKFKISDAWEGPIERWLTAGVLDASGMCPADALRLTVADIAAGALSIPASHIDRGREMRIGRAMRGLGWRRVRQPADDKGYRAWAYEPPLS